MIARNDQHVGRGLGVDVADNDTAVVLINHIGGSSARQNLAKEAVGLTHARMISQSPDSTQFEPSELVVS